MLPGIFYRPLRGSSRPARIDDPLVETDASSKPSTLAAICGMTLLAGLLFRHSKIGVFAFVVDIATWLRGGPMPEVVTWPAWGYAWVVAWLPSFGWIIALQAALGALALGMLASRMRKLIPAQGTLIAVLCVFALPWHDLEVTLYPSAPAASLALLALLSLERALGKGSFRWALAAGILILIGK